MTSRRQNPDRSIKILTEEDYKSIIDQSWQLRREKRYAEAELLLHEALDNQRAGSYANRLLRANLADILMHRKNISEARKLALAVLTEDPDQVIALTVLGMIALEKKEPAEAIENLEKANRLMPSGYRAGRLARAHELDGNPLKALEVLDKALRHNPRDGFLLRQYNSLRDKTTEISEVAEKINTTGQTAGSDIDEEDHLPYAEQIRAKLHNLEAAEAVKQLEKLIKIGKRKNNPYLHLLHGDLLREASDEEAAMSAYSRARELDPQNMLALSQLLFSLRRLGREEEAWPLLKLLLYHRPGDITAKSSLIKDAQSLGKEKETLLFFEELLQKNPERRELYGAIRKLHNAVIRKEGNSYPDENQ